VARPHIYAQLIFQIDCLTRESGRWEFLNIYLSVKILAYLPCLPSYLPTKLVCLSPTMEYDALNHDTSINEILH
jgi:hypothetical protein